MIDCLLPWVKRAHSHVCMTLWNPSWHLQWQSEGSVARLLLMVARAWHESFTERLIVFLRKMSSPTCLYELCFIQNCYINYYSRKNVSSDAVSSTVPHHNTSCTLLCSMFSHSCQLLQMWWPTFFDRMRRYELSNLAMKSMGFFSCFFASCTITICLIAYKSHSRPLPNKLHNLTHLSRVCGKPWFPKRIVIVIQTPKLCIYLSILQLFTDFLSSSLLCGNLEGFLFFICVYWTRSFWVEIFFFTYLRNFEGV